MNNTMKISLITCIFLLIGMSSAMSQSRKYARLQHDLSFEKYEKTWFGKELAKLKEAKRDTKQSVKSSRKSTRRGNKLVKLRQEISSIAARKEGNDE